MVLVFLTASPTQSPTFALDVRGAPGCPQTHEIKEQISHRLGLNPWSDDPSYLASVVFTQETHPAFAARVFLQDSSGAVVGEKIVRGDDCGDLGDTAALTLSLVMQDLQTQRLTPSAPAYSGSGGALSADTPAPRAVEPTPQRPFALVIEGGPTFEAFTLPMAAFGAELGLAMAASWFSLGVRGRVLAPITYRPQGAQVNAVALGASLEACGNPSIVSICLLAQASALSFSVIGLTEPRAFTAPLVVAGLRVGVRLPAGNGFSLRPYATLLVPLLRTSLAIDNANVWVAPPVGLGLGVDLTYGWRFL